MGNKLYWKATLRIVDDAGERCFGPGVAALLEGVEEKRSLRAAAISMEMAYSKAWRIIRQAEDELGVRLIDRDGAHGSTLTEEGATFLARYREMLAAADAAANMVFNKYYN